MRGMEKQFFVYILTNKSYTLYIGVTNNLIKRLYEHKNRLVDGFTKKYNIHRLIYYEIYATALVAIEREKQLKRWSRSKKMELIKRVNPMFHELII